MFFFLDKRERERHQHNKTMRLCIVGAPQSARAVGRSILYRGRIKRRKDPIAATLADVWPTVAAAVGRPVFVFEDARRRTGQLYEPGAPAASGGARCVYDGATGAVRGIDWRHPVRPARRLADVDAFLVQRIGYDRYVRLTTRCLPPLPRRPPRFVVRLLRRIWDALEATGSAGIGRDALRRLLDAYAAAGERPVSR